MSSERTEAPSPRRIREARRRGQVAVSADLVGAAALAGGLVALAFGAPGRLEALSRGLQKVLSQAPLAPPDPAVALVEAGTALAGAVLLPAAGALAGALCAGFLQTGFLFAPAALSPQLERLDPFRGLRRLFSVAQLGAVGMGLAKASVLLTVGACWLESAGPSLVRLGVSPPAALWRALPLAGDLVVRLALALVALGVVDLLRLRARHLRSLRMTRDEARRELREDEGDPAMRMERRRSHRGLLEAGPVSRATVVIVNPTRVAVALRHERGGGDAPRVIAKGIGAAAARIRSAARRAGVPVVRDVPLARALHRLVDLGEEIPEELYHAAAVVLVHLYGHGERR